jgi:hypothetical protein
VLPRHSARHSLHGLLEAERSAIVDLFEAWPPVSTAAIASSLPAAHGWNW